MTAMYTKRPGYGWESIQAPCPNCARLGVVLMTTPMSARSFCVHCDWVGPGFSLEQAGRFERFMDTRTGAVARGLARVTGLGLLLLGSWWLFLHVLLPPAWRHTL